MAKPNVKQLVVNHFEKGIFAVVCLVALALLAGTRWAPYDRYPTEITRNVNEAEQKIAGREWSPEEQAKFVIPEEETVVALVKHIGRQIDPTPYEFDVSFSPGLYDTTKPITEPEHGPIAELIADPGRFLMAMAPKKPDAKTSEDPALMAQEATEEEDDQADVPEEFRKRSSAAAGAAGLGSSGAGLGLGLGAGYDEYAGY